MSKALQSKKGKQCSSARSAMAPAAGAGGCPFFLVLKNTCLSKEKTLCPSG